MDIVVKSEGDNNNENYEQFSTNQVENNFDE